MNVSIIGCNGFLGDALRKHPLVKEWNLLLFGRHDIDAFKNEHFIKADLLNDFSFQKLLDQDIVFYCAGAGIQSGEPVDNKKLYYMNTYFPIALAEYLSENNFKGTLYSFGSYFEIGNNATSKKFSEKELVFSPYEVPNAYCVSKRLLTKYLYDKKPVIKHVHFLLPTIYGEHENENRLIPYLVRNMKRLQPVFLTEGKQVRQYLYVNDLIEIIFKTYEQLSSGIYNIPGKCTLTVKELAYKIAWHFKFPLNESAFNTAERKDISMHDLQLADGAIQELLKDFQFKKIEEIIPKYRTNEFKG